LMGERSRRRTSSRCSCTSAAPTAKICEPDEGIRNFDLAGTTGTLKADGTTTGDAFVVAEWTLAPGSFAPPPHRHREIAESLYVLAGRLDLHVGEDHRIAVPGKFVSIPAGVPHTMSVAGEEPVRMLMITSSTTRSLQMYEILEEVFAAGEPDPETAGAQLARLDMEMLAPAAS
jgi:quercetin dioxygenase-like cupin family protein